MSVPALRFTEFHDSWKASNLGDLADVTTGAKDTQDRVDDGAYPFFVRSQTVERINSFSFDGEAILTSGDGVGVGKNFHYVNGKFDFHQRVYCIRNFKNQVSGKFIFHYFAEKFNQRVMRLSAKNSVDSVRRTMITEMPVLIPSLPEQTKIANFFTAVDEKLAQLTRKHDLLTQYKKGVMQQIFSQELRFKDDDGREFPEWIEREIKDIAEVNPKSESLPDEFIYIDLESVEKGILLKESVIMKDGAPSRAQRLLQMNDVLFQMVRPYQGNNLLFRKSGSYVASTGYAQLRTSESPVFLYYLLHLESFTAEVMNRCTGTSYPAINSSDLASMPIHVPCKVEQIKIANFLSSIDEKITVVQTQLAATQQFKQGLLQQMFV